MEAGLYSVDQVADLLGLHVRTVRGYVREGKLTAVRIGKQYRIAQQDLEAFIGRPVPAAEPVRRHRHVEVSSIVEIDAISPETAGRVSSLLMGAAGSRRPGEPRLRVETAYDEERGRMKVIVLGGLGDSARLLEYIATVVEP
ncbi:helix-turn-helix domain-containing protein [Sphaerisporangium sp. TRM90804]|uniref:helix-turn-helix domain-containing protein n=1 Tax=Sphaerisporangium sp. TRM90804 TaxID=3031113 RepID=UPI0024473C9E|nr:helix-turn-helix domain-containing protein [Sphaerisporangium sp. TRM90804]MDH2430589.1 helix-turn-helix domain-containing protein [Sphaerisporangium sp. TRM90804]